MPMPIDANHILLGREPASPEDAVRTIGELMVAAGEVTNRYLEGMIEKEARYGTWLMDGVALPHGTNEVKSEVRKSSVVVLQMPKGVDWGNGRTVYLAFGLAGKGDEHLHLLAGLAAVLEEKELVKQMMQTTDVREIVEILSEVRA
jgi:mannitol/fructose-specific phosphotransferase system IIA component